jgi:hypothetical protein
MIEGVTLYLLGERPHRPEPVFVGSEIRQHAQATLPQVIGDAFRAQPKGPRFPSFPGRACGGRTAHKKLGPVENAGVDIREDETPTPSQTTYPFDDCVDRFRPQIVTDTVPQDDCALPSVKIGLRQLVCHGLPIEVDRHEAKMAKINP